MRMRELASVCEELASARTQLGELQAVASQNKTLKEQLKEVPCIILSLYIIAFLTDCLTLVSR